jgi:methyl-accepting chemotaxis protein
VTQANASQTEELSSTAEGLASQAEQLQALVARFKLEEGNQRPTAVQAPVHITGTMKKPAVKKASKPSRAKSPAQPVREVPTAKQEPVHELELVEVGASSNGHGGFEEF